MSENRTVPTPIGGDRMSSELRAWMRDQEARPGYLAEVMAAVDTTPQRRIVLGRPWRIATRPSFARLAAGAVAIFLIAAVGLTLQPQPAIGPAADLGIFAPVSGRILSGLWGADPEAIDPSDPARSTTLRMGSQSVLPLGWSSDGTELLFMRRAPNDGSFQYAANLFILHADGTETQVANEPAGGAAISPDGSRVVFAGATEGDDGLYVVDADGGEPVRIGTGEEPTFSPDGTRIAYLSRPRDGCCHAPGREHVWVMDSDGTDPHEILVDEPALAEGGDQLAWSPAGDRIALGGSHEGSEAIYTFAPDGSGFTKVITGGMNPYWSPDGSRIAYMRPYGGPFPGLGIADADGSNSREFGLGASGPWHPGPLQETVEAPASPSPALSPASPSPSLAAPTPSPLMEARQIIAEGRLNAFAATGSGTLLTIWGKCAFLETGCRWAWRLGDGMQPRAAGVVQTEGASADSGDVFVPIAAGDGFILVPPLGDDGGIRIAPDGTASPISMACRDASWTTPTEPGRLIWTAGLEFVDTVAGTRCPASRLGGRSEGPAGVFTDEGTLWQLVDNEIGPDTLTIGRYDGAEWRYHDFTAQSGSWTSVLAAAGSTVVVLLANPEPSPRPDRLVGLAVSTDGGATWTEVTDPDVLARDLPFSAFVSTDAEEWYSGYTSMAFAGPATLYLADRNGDLWRSTDFTTFNQVTVPGGVIELQSAGDAVIGRSKQDGNALVRISADGSVEPITVH